MKEFKCYSENEYEMLLGILQKNHDVACWHSSLTIVIK